MSEHIGFWTDLGGKIGPPIFSGTLVACLLSSRFELMHGSLLGLGLGLIVLSHRRQYHRG